MAINTLTESADRVIIRLTPYVTLRVSKPHSYLSVENNSMGGNVTETEIVLMLKYQRFGVPQLSNACGSY